MAINCSIPRSRIPINDILGLFGRAFQLYLANLSTIVKIALAAFIPASIITTLMALCLPGFESVWQALWLDFTHRNDSDYQPPATIDYKPQFFLFLALYYIGYILYCFAASATLRIAGDANSGGEHTTFTTAIDHATTCYASVFLAGCLVADVSYFASLFLLLPGLYLALSWWMTIPIIVTEGLGIFAAMRRSWGLADGYRLDLMKVVVVYLAGYVVVYFVVHLLLLLLPIPRAVRLMVGYSLPMVVVQPCVVVLQSVVYWDLRDRFEALPASTEPLLT